MDKTILFHIRKELLKKIDLRTKNTAKNFFKEKIKLLGVRVPLVKQIAKDYFEKIKSEGKGKIFTLCQQLFKTGYMEEAFIACDWSYLIRNRFEENDFKIFERWVNLYVNNWAVCDKLSNHTIGSLIEKYPILINRLYMWTDSDNRWVKRAAAVSLILPARKGKFLKQIIHIADKLLTDPDDLVQKGYGWLLKVASQSNEKHIFDYVVKNKDLMPRTALRYAIEKMPKKLRMQAMKKI